MTVQFVSVPILRAMATRAEATTETANTVSLAELLVLAAMGVIGVTSLVALALAHAHAYSLVMTMAVSAVALLVAAGVVLRFDRPSLRLDTAATVPTLAAMALGAVLFIPGFRYATGDRDPGVYVETALAISRTKGIPFPDDLVQAGLPGGYGPGAQWPGLWDQPGHPGQIFPQFYHLWSALMAVTKDVGGYTGLFNTGPVVGIVALAATVLVGRRIAGLPGAWTAAVILPTNMIEVWQAKYPSSEIYGQMLFMGMVLGVVLAVRTGWRAAAGLAGVMLSLAYLERPDFLLIVVFVWLVLGLLFAVGAFDSRAWWFTAGLLVLLPYGWYQAYDLAKHYTLANGVPTLTKVGGGMVAVAAVAAAARWLRPRWLPVVQRQDTAGMRFGLGTAFIAVCAVLVVLGGLRPALFGIDYTHYGSRIIRSYDEISFIRFTWFFSLTGIALMCAGIAYVGWRRWRFDRWMIALATTGLLALYCYHVRNSPYLMWDFRRFVPTVLPGMVLLMGCGAAGIAAVARWIAAQRKIAGQAMRTASALAVAALLVGLSIFQLRQSWPLRLHNENGGSLQVEQHLAALSADSTGVYLWQRAGACCDAPYQLFGGPMLASMGQSSALLPPPGPLEASAISRYVNYFGGSGRPIFYVAAGDGPAPAVAGVTATKVARIAGALPHWEETYVTRPDRSGAYVFTITVYRLTKS